MGDVRSGQASGALTACASGTKRVASRGSYLSRIAKLFIWDVPHDVKMFSTKFENIRSPFGYQDQGWTVGCHPCARKRIGRRAEGRKLGDCEKCYYGMFPYVFGLQGQYLNDAISVEAESRRFNAATLEVPSASADVLSNASAQCLNEGEFFRSLAKKPTTRFDNLLAIAKKYVNMEEVTKMKDVGTGITKKEKKGTSPAARRTPS
ncbi:hypothetical protein BUALT_Bualt19G0023700 [Buddleja alternifolia]|uniref:Uncharacterized protein n=1 Tax=Buddleja alternifolia TaxID=168488 RepID=A0AAV6W1B9_9LAMI|nr:hypothetical protein BUALT_Bualt19G0023700 [Buddleja alternifolia]